MNERKTETPKVNPNDFVILSMVVKVGIYGLLTKRQLLKVFISIELVATVQR